MTKKKAIFICEGIAGKEKTWDACEGCKITVKDTPVEACILPTLCPFRAGLEITWRRK